MDVQQVQGGFLSHLIHSRGKRQSVRRVIEERIGRDLHFMEVNPLVRFAEPDGHGVTDEMDFVAACGKFDAQLCSYDSRATVGWIACDSDFHKCSFDCSSPLSRRASHESACARRLANARFSRPFWD